MTFRIPSRQLANISIAAAADQTLMGEAMARTVHLVCAAPMIFIRADRKFAGELNFFDCENVRPLVRSTKIRFGDEDSLKRRR